MTIILNAQGTRIDLGTTKVELHSAPSFQADAGATALEGLQTQAESNHQQYEVVGRNAMIELMSQVYGLWWSAKASPQFDSFMGKVKEKLKAAGIKLRSTSKASSIVIRFVFKHFDDKQVHVYGRALEVARKRGTKPEDFADLIRSTTGGFDGLRDEGKSNPSNMSSPAAALSACQHEPTVDTTESLAWADGQVFRVLIAIRKEGSDTADLKDALLDAKQSEMLLRQFKANRQRRDKATVSAEDSNMAATGTLNAMAAGQQSRLDVLQAQLREAERAGEPLDKLRFDVSVCESVLKTLQQGMKQHQPAANA